MDDIKPNEIETWTDQNNVKYILASYGEKFIFQVFDNDAEKYLWTVTSRQRAPIERRYRETVQKVRRAE